MRVTDLLLTTYLNCNGEISRDLVPGSKQFRYWHKSAEKKRPPEGGGQSNRDDASSRS
jgi:hypothetical protein